MARIQHIALVAKDPEKLAEVYETSFGMQETDRHFMEGTPDTRTVYASNDTNRHHDQTVALGPATVRRRNRRSAGTALDAAGIQALIDVVAQYKLIDRAFAAREMFSK